MPDPKALVQPAPGDAHQCLTGSIRILPELCSMELVLGRTRWGVSLVREGDSSVPFPPSLSPALRLRSQAAIT